MESGEIRRVARENLKDHWPYAIGVGILACIMGGMLTGSDFTAELTVNIENEDIESIRDALLVLWKNGGLTISIASLLALFQFVFGGTVQLGYAKFLLMQHDRQDPNASLLFSKFNCFGDGFLQHLLRRIYVFLWSLLFVVPGIVASYSYSMTPFIMAEHPDMSASEAIAASKDMMQGHKGELFCLDLSFIGWSFLCGLTAGIGYIALNPYTNAARAVFYRNLQPRPAQTDPEV